MAKESLTISCSTCVHQHSNRCEDCLVTFVLGREADDAIVIDAEEVRAMRVLERAGLVPAIRHEARAG